MSLLQFSFNIIVIIWLVRNSLRADSLDREIISIRMHQYQAGCATQRAHNVR